MHAFIVVKSIPVVLLPLTFSHQILGNEAVQVRHKGVHWTPLQVTPVGLRGQHYLVIKDTNKVLSMKGLPQLDKDVGSLCMF